jgi:hypothetical protein
LGSFIDTSETELVTGAPPAKSQIPEREAPSARTPFLESTQSHTDFTQLLKPASQDKPDRNPSPPVVLAQAESSKNIEGLQDRKKSVGEPGTSHLLISDPSPSPASPTSMEPTFTSAATLNHVEIASTPISPMPVAATSIAHATTIIQRTLETVPAPAPITIATPPAQIEPAALKPVTVTPPTSTSPAVPPMTVVIKPEPEIVTESKEVPVTLVQPLPPPALVIPQVRKQTERPATRPVHVRIGTIEVQNSSPSPVASKTAMPAPTAPVAEGFGDYTGLRTYVRWDRS